VQCNSVCPRFVPKADIRVLFDHLVGEPD
jgi:hypothetical protein